MFCHKCGKQVPDDAGFCFKCGTKIARNENIQNTLEKPVSTATPKPVESIASVSSIPTASTAVEYESPTQYTSTVNKKKKRLISLLAAVIGVIAIALIVTIPAKQNEEVAEQFNSELTDSTIQAINGNSVNIEPSTEYIEEELPLITPAQKYEIKPGDLLYNDIPVKELLSGTDISNILGNPITKGQDYSGNYYEFNDVTFHFAADNDGYLVGYDLSMFSIDGITLDKSGLELEEIIGLPVDSGATYITYFLPNLNVNFFMEPNESPNEISISLAKEITSEEARKCIERWLEDNPLPYDFITLIQYNDHVADNGMEYYGFGLFTEDPATADGDDFYLDLLVEKRTASVYRWDYYTDAIEYLSDWWFYFNSGAASSGNGSDQSSSMLTVDGYTPKRGDTIYAINPGIFGINTSILMGTIKSVDNENSINVDWYAVIEYSIFGIRLDPTPIYSDQLGLKHWYYNDIGTEITIFSINTNMAARNLYMYPPSQLG